MMDQVMASRCSYLPAVAEQLLQHFQVHKVLARDRVATHMHTYTYIISCYYCIDTRTVRFHTFCLPHWCAQRVLPPGEHTPWFDHCGVPLKWFAPIFSLNHTYTAS